MRNADARRVLLSLSSRKRREANAYAERGTPDAHGTSEREPLSSPLLLENERVSRTLTTDTVASRGRFDLGIELVGAERGTRRARWRTCACGRERPSGERS